MQYSEEFKQKVLAVFNNNEDIKKRLDEGQLIVGRILDDSSYNTITSKEIVEACESMNVQGIYQKAKRQLAIQELYNEWSELYRSQREQQQQQQPHR